VARYDQIVEHADLPVQLSAAEFQRDMALFAGVTLDLDYYGEKQQLEYHPLYDDGIFDRFRLRKTLITRIESCQDIAALILLVDRGQDFARVVSGLELTSLFGYYERNVLAFIERQYLSAGFFAVFEVLSQLGGLPPVPMVVTRAPRRELTLQIGDAIQTSAPGFVTLGAFARRDGVPGFVTVAHAFDGDGSIHTRTRDYTRNDGIVLAEWDSSGGCKL
jgi:hypothetical protein